jgi:hypothetical protein
VIQFKVNQERQPKPSHQEYLKCSVSEPMPPQAMGSMYKKEPIFIENSSIAGLFLERISFQIRKPNQFLLCVTLGDRLIAVVLSV